MNLLQARGNKRIGLKRQNINHQRILSTINPAFSLNGIYNTGLRAPIPEALFAGGMTYQVSNPPQIPTNMDYKNCFPSGNLGAESHGHSGEVFEDVPGNQYRTAEIISHILFDVIS